ncbi:MAG: hypothetical protein CMJ18_18125 [Phycisphaeraceae bacterium]|nr:hypothetical protein [Phycisphaeraceae bacterium]
MTALVALIIVAVGAVGFGASWWCLQGAAALLDAGAAWKTYLGAGVITAVVAVVSVLLTIRFVSPLRAMAFIRQSLMAAHEGETAPDVVTVRDDLGLEADAWNGLMNRLHRQLGDDARQRFEESLVEQRRTSSDLDGAFDAIWQGLIIVDSGLNARYANGAAGVLLQARQEQIVGAPIDRVIEDAQVLDAIRGAMGGAMRQRRTFEIERTNEQEAGMLRISVRPVRRTDPDSVIVMIEDITQLRAAEDARHAFVAQATHELRTPLTNIRLYVESLLEDDSDTLERAKSINIINQEARRLERIVGDMLSVAEIEAGSLQLACDDVRLDDVFEQIEGDFRAQAAEKSLALAFELPPKLPVIRGDRDKVVLAVHNLVGNALKYTPAGGSVTVRVEVDDQQLTVMVEDTGIGISAEEQSKVFEKFFRSADCRVSDVTGSGLGLALAQQVIRMHGGDIAVASEVDVGTTFTLSLPVHQEAA